MNLCGFDGHVVPVVWRNTHPATLLANVRALFLGRELVLHCVLLPRNQRGLTVFIVDNSLHFVKNFSRFVLKGLASHVYNSPIEVSVHATEFDLSTEILLTDRRLD